MSKFTSANPSVRLGTRRLIYYLIITGKGNGYFGYHWSISKPIPWLVAGDYENVLAVQVEGVNFSIYDFQPYAPNVIYQKIMREILGQEGLLNS